jgi:hypothetical protein
MSFPSPCSRSRSALFAVAIAALALSACGKSAEEQAVVTVGKHTITKATLAHWMSAVAGSDYAAIVRGRAPLGLVSEPADYGACVSAAARIPLDPKAKGRLSSTQLQQKCRQLHTAIKEQALTYLIPGLWRTIEGEELGTGVSDREVSKELQKIRYSEYPSAAAFARYLAERHWSISDERYEIKRTLLIGNYGAKIRRQAAELGGGEPTIAQLVQQSLAKWSAKTDCAPGYTAIQCAQRKGAGAGASPSAAQLLEQLSGKSS